MNEIEEMNTNPVSYADMELDDRINFLCPAAMKTELSERAKAERRSLGNYLNILICEKLEKESA